VSANWNWDNNDGSGLPAYPKKVRGKRDEKYPKWVADVNGYHISLHPKLGYMVCQKAPFKYMNLTKDDRGDKMLMRIKTIEDATMFAEGLPEPSTDLFTNTSRKRSR